MPSCFAGLPSPGSEVHALHPSACTGKASTGTQLKYNTGDSILRMLSMRFQLHVRICQHSTAGHHAKGCSAEDSGCCEVAVGVRIVDGALGSCGHTMFWCNVSSAGLSTTAL